MCGGVVASSTHQAKGELGDPKTQAERQLRHKLGIPPEADRVLLFAESSHWDPNWLHTSAVYYRKYV